ncbi:hypothetical protein [Herpetosiphon sp.]|uniref:SnoaL-like domain-containing protein n=1 Tax=Herpetosiphon aurantiacus (strain ATCC 23779 / DSM 785 / 114-95) TaxID=316274 RepID=A9AYU7_HERA2|nr:hypothetical protein [Herpetosiphon sp.]ABX06987.1 hypothetical protein Haur_4355 [Herpetosiphon aurantiacus DSM 785]
MHRYSRLMLILGLALLSACSNSSPATIQPLPEQPTASIPAANPDQPTSTPAVSQTAVSEDNSAPPSPPNLPAFDDRQDPLSLLASFYNAINRADYQRAYGYFEVAPMPFDQFEQGYEQTLSVKVLIDPHFVIDVGAGNQNTRVAAGLIAYDRQAGWQYFVGCYELHRVNINGPTEPWQIRNSQFELTNDLQAMSQQLGQICPAIEPPARVQTPEQTLALYISTLNQANYAQAWNYWHEQPASDVAAWSQQFESNQFIQVVINPQGLIDAGAGNLYYSTNLVWLTNDQAGQLQVQAGCVTLHRNNTEPDQPWKMQNLTLQTLQANPRALDQSLNNQCQ